MILFLCSIGFVLLACHTSDSSNEKGSSDSDDNDDDADSQDNDDAKMAFDYRSSYDMPEDVWSDPESGLMWQVWPKLYDWESAIEYCKSTDYFGYNDWRLPSITELRSLIRGCSGTQAGGGCNVSETCNDQSDECWTDECHGCTAFVGPGEGGIYWPNEMVGIDGYEDSTSWSITKVPYSYYSPNNSWTVVFYNGRVGTSSKYYERLVRCVR